MSHSVENTDNLQLSRRLQGIARIKKEISNCEPTAKAIIIDLFYNLFADQNV
jgi:hypothetical protein